MGEDRGIAVVPSDGFVEVGGVHEEGVGSVAGKFRKPFVEGERYPLQRTVDGG
jgi:hypothetical protein